MLKGTISPPGIDKSVIKPNVLSFDYQKLAGVNNKTLDTTGITLPMIDNTTGEVVEVSNIVINDGNFFKDLRIGVNSTNGNVIRYSKLDLSRMGIDDDNLIPYDIETYKKHADKVIQYIFERYGIELDKNDLKGEVLELNTNIILDRPFEEYKYLLLTMFENGLGGKHRFKGEPSYDENKEVNGFILRNSNMSIKIYNKRLQMEEVKKRYLHMEVMRIELTLKNQNAIEDVLGTCYLENVTDEQIKTVLLDIIDKNLIKPLQKHIDKTDKELPKILKTEKKRDIKKWKRSFLLKAGYTAFDIQQVLGIIKAESPKNYSRDIKKLQSDIEDLAHLSDNLLKLTEIKNKLFI